jgi:hypothetical protein
MAKTGKVMLAAARGRQVRGGSANAAPPNMPPPP